MFEWIRGTIASLGYAGVVVLTFLENVFPPIPSEVVIPLAGFVAAEGNLTLWGVIACGTFGSVTGAILWYEVGRRLGKRRLREWVDHSGWWLTLSAEDVDKADDWFRRHGNSAVFIGRLVPGVRSLVSIPAGFARMPLGSFMAYSAAGTLIWTAALAYAGVVLRANFAIVSDYIDGVSYVVFGGFAVLLVRRYVRCWKTRGGLRPTLPR